MQYILFADVAFAMNEVAKMDAAKRAESEAGKKKQGDEAE